MFFHFTQESCPKNAGYIRSLYSRINIMIKRLFFSGGKKNFTDLTGKIAVTDSDMSPSGTVIIDNEIYNAKTDDNYIEAGRGVRVTRVCGKRIYVRRV